MKTRDIKLLGAAALLLGSLLASPAWAHGDVTPQAIDTHTLPSLGEGWRDENPYRADTANRPEALRIGTSGFAQNCARCHGLEAVSGGIAPDLRKLDRDCMDIADKKEQGACYKEMDQYFLATIRRGRVRDGRVYMPPFEGVFSQEAMWSIKTYLESRRTNEQ